MKRIINILVCLISLQLTYSFIGCGRSGSSVGEQTADTDYMEMNEESYEIEDNNADYDPKKFSTAQLDAFALMGDVHVVKYDSLLLKYNREGELEYFGFNDSINLLQNAEYKLEGASRRLETWGADDWKFENRTQSIYLPSTEGIMLDFLIHYPEGGYDRYIVSKKARPGTPSPTDSDYGKERGRTVTLSVEYRNFRRKGEVPQPDNFIYDQYEYDEYGNWIARRVKCEHRATKHEKREITYYSQE